MKRENSSRPRHAEIQLAKASHHIGSKGQRHRGASALKGGYHAAGNIYETFRICQRTISYLDFVIHRSENQYSILGLVLYAKTAEMFTSPVRQQPSPLVRKQGSHSSQNQIESSQKDTPSFGCVDLAQYLIDPLSSKRSTQLWAESDHYRRRLWQKCIDKRHQRPMIL
jgi:hypothetical protein